MPYKAVSPDDPAMAQMNFEQAYTSALSGVLGGLYLQLIADREAVFLQMIEDERLLRGLWRES